MRKHAADCLLDCAFRTLSHEIAIACCAQTTGATGVAVGHLLVKLLTGEGNLVRINDDDVIAHIEVRGKRRLVLPTKDSGNLSRQATEDDVSGVDDVPLLVGIRRLR